MQQTTGARHSALANHAASPPQTEGDDFPQVCQDALDQGVLVDCVGQGDDWAAIPHQEPMGSGVPGSFVGLFLLGVFVAIGATLWRVSVARASARRAGMDPNEATAVTLLSDNGLEATYLAASLRDQPPAAPAQDAPTPADRLRHLEELRSQGLVTQAEYATKRAEILDQL
jgi:hypothetical protein